MRREQLFSESGFYGFVLQSNVLLHRQATRLVTGILEKWLVVRRNDAPVRVLDLACGGWPASVAGVMRGFSDTRFDYLGVDINPDQVRLASQTFRFPANVTRARLIEGNAWDPGPQGIAGHFDLIYSGMNLHHGTPEELAFLARQLKGLIADNGLLVSHDVYRPRGTAYLRRPDHDPLNPAKSWRLVPLRRLEQSDIAPRRREGSASRDEPEWRRAYLERMHRVLTARGADPSGALSTVDHMRQRDYPVSCEEFKAIFGAAGFRAEEHEFDAPEEPMAEFIALCTARPLNVRRDFGRQRFRDVPTPRHGTAGR